MSLQWFYDSITAKHGILKESLLKAVNLSDKQYEKLMTTEEGKKKLHDVLQKKPEWKQYFIRLDTIEKYRKLIEDEYNEYLPF